MLSIRSHLHRIALSVLFVVALSATAPASASQTPMLFNTTEKASTNLQAFPKWAAARKRARDERLAPEKCLGTYAKPCHLKAWNKLVARLKNKDLMIQVNEVHREMNARRYIIDPINWGLEDYWASPLQFYRKNGDCEDYAISKFVALRALGVPNEKMRIVVLQDLNLRVGHAVLAVYEGPKIYILDNQLNSVTTSDRIRHYKPFYSINETTWWLHRS